MNKDQFNKLDIDEQVEHLNKLINEEGSLTKACERLTISRSTVRDRFNKRAYSFSKKLNAYVKEIEHKHNTSVTNADEHNENTSVLLNEDARNKFMWMMSNFDVLQELINERIKKEHNCNTTVIEVVSTEFTIDLPDAASHHTTIRINKEVWDEFNDIYISKYKHLNKMDVLSMALKHFNDKHR